jgi:hypothetical protein
MIKMRKQWKSNLVVALCIIICDVYAGELSLIWEKECGDQENLSYVAHEGVFQDGFLNSIGYAFEFQGHSSGKYWYWKIDASGDTFLQSDLYAITDGRSSTIGFGSWRTKGMKISPEKIRCVGEFGTNIPSIANYSKDNKRFDFEPVQPDPKKKPEEIEKGPEEIILRMIPLSDNQSLLLGSDGKSRCFAKKVDDDGDVIWHKVYEKGTIAFLTDAVEVGDGFILLGCYTDGDPVKKPYEGYQCRLIRCDSEGNILSEKTFAGGGAFPNKYPELHKIDASRYLVSYDKESLPNRANFSAAAYSDTLELLWQRTIYNGEVRVPMYGHVMPLTSGGFISVYSAMSHDEAAMNLKVHLYSETGEMSDSLTLQNYIAIDDFLLVGSEKTLYVVALSGPEDDTYRVKVKVCAIAIE